jgi:hypothetical protein
VKDERLSLPRGEPEHERDKRGDGYRSYHSFRDCAAGRDAGLEVADLAADQF